MALAAKITSVTYTTTATDEEGQTTTIDLSLSGQLLVTADDIDTAQPGTVILSQSFQVSATESEEQIAERILAYGRRVLPARWVDDVLTPDAKRVVEPEADLHYQQGWWVYAPVGGRQHAVAGQGHLGQYVFVYPELDVVVARFGSAIGGVGSWRAVFDQVACEAATLASLAPACG